MKAKKVNEAKAVSESGEIVKFDEVGMPQLDVWLEDETIWLTQKQMGFLFGCAPQNITYHLREIYKIGELEAEMREAAASLNFERAAELRDMIFELKSED